MERTISAAQLATNITDIMNRVRYQSEQFIIEQDGEPIAALTPTPSPRKTTTFQELADALRDIPSPDPGFADDVEAIQRSQPPAWDSTWDS